MKCGCTLSTRGDVVSLPNHLRPRILSGLRDGEVSSILSAAKHRKFRASTIVVHQDDAAERFFLLASGHGKQFVLTSQGRKVPLLWLTAGQTFGGATILASPTQYLASTEVLTDSCTLTWERQTIRKLVCSFRDLLDNFLSISFTEHITSLVAAQVLLVNDDARGRLAQLLLSLGSGVGVPTSEGIELQIKNEDLAAGANVSQFTASRTLSEWQRAGIVTKRRGKLVLRKPEFLLAS